MIAAPHQAVAAEATLFRFGPDASLQTWQPVDDTVMGGISRSEWQPSGRFAGSVSLENNGGFCSVRSPALGFGLGEFNALRAQSRQAQTHTDTQREEAQALYPEAQALAVDICDTVEFFYRKDPNASSRRQKAMRWGVVYLYEPGETPDPAPPPNP